MKIYLAGPDVFRPDVASWAASAKDVCRRYGYEALLPIDHAETQPDRIFAANLALIRKAQIIVANLNPFRGAEPDSGTCFELGYALSLGKRLCGYVTRLDTVAQRVEQYENRSQPLTPYGDRLADREGMTIENFGLPCNLMLAMSAQIVEGNLEACLQAIKARPVMTA